MTARPFRNPEDLGLKNEGVKMQATFLYADRADSTELAIGGAKIAAEVFKGGAGTPFRRVLPIASESTWACLDALRRWNPALLYRDPTNNPPLKRDRETPTALF